MDGLLSVNNEISACEISATKILQKLIKIESPSIVKENMNLILLLAANCRSHILEHVKQNLNTKPNFSRESKSSKKMKTSGNHCAPKGDVKVEVESSDDGNEMNTNETANHQSREEDLDTNTEDMNPLDVIVQRSNEMEEEHRLDYLKMGQHFLDLQDETGIDESYEDYDDNIDDDASDPLYGGGSSSTAQYSKLGTYKMYSKPKKSKQQNPGFGEKQNTRAYNRFSEEMVHEQLMLIRTQDNGEMVKLLNGSKQMISKEWPRLKGYWDNVFAEWKRTFPESSISKEQFKKQYHKRTSRKERIPGNESLEKTGGES